MPIPYFKKTARWSATKKTRPTVKIRKVVLRARPTGQRQNKNDKKSFWKTKFFKFILLLAAIGIIAVAIFIFIISRNLPSPDQLITREIPQSTTIYDRSGEHSLYEIHGEQKRTLVKLDGIPDNVKHATIAIEDKNFYKHGGISVWAMFRTLVTNVVFRKSAGGSTLTQQFIKNAVLTNEKKISRKIKEIILAQRLENKFSKDEVLQMYLNEIPYGSNAYGVQAASQKYFGKDVKDVNLAEAAVLAALPQAPSRYSPYGPNQDLLLGRQKYILDLMVEQGYITSQERDDAKNVQIKFKPLDNNISAPHFVMYIKDILSEKYGEKTVEQGGLKIYTTLDWDKQKIAEEIVKDKTTDYEKKYNAKNAALVSVDPKTGQILAMVGSKDYFNEDIDGQVNITTSLRQPGSSIKPIVYSALFMKGYTPNTILNDVVINFAVSGKPYIPHNYNGKENGFVSIRQALAGSLNIPAVEAIYLAGIKNVIGLAKEMGYSTLTDPDRFGLSLVLGGGEVKMLEHVNAYSAFATEGEVHNISGILKVQDKDGKVLEEFKDRKKTVFPAKIAQMINSVLSDNGARAFIFGEKNFLTLGSRPVAAKTGTTNDYKDAWTIGYTPSLVAGVWVGNNDSKEMKRGSDGSVLAAPIWNEFMKQALKDSPVESFNDPGDIKTGKPIIDGDSNVGKVYDINKETGALAATGTPSNLIEKIAYSNPHCILYYVNKDDPLGPVPKNPANDPQFTAWEAAIIEWAKKNNLYSTSTPPNLPGSGSVPEFEIVNPKNNTLITEPVLKADINISSIGDNNARAEYYLNNRFFYRTSTTPYNLNQSIDFLPNGYYNLKVRLCDGFYNCSEKSVEFNLLANNSKQSPASLNLVFPTSGLPLSGIDFPLPVKMSTLNPEKITKIQIFYLDENDNKKLAGEVSEIKGQEIETTWNEKPEAGSYKIYAEFYDWAGNMKKTNKVTVSVN